MWDSVKIIYMHVTKKPEKVKRERADKILKEIMAEIFLNVLNHQSTHPGNSMNPSRINAKKSINRFTIVKMFKDKTKKKILKKHQEKKGHIICMESPVRLTNFSLEKHGVPKYHNIL